jgi:hypothetical protein
VEALQFKEKELDSGFRRNDEQESDEHGRRREGNPMRWLIRRVLKKAKALSVMKRTSTTATC